jgi:hypothetical protein
LRSTREGEGKDQPGKESEGEKTGIENRVKRPNLSSRLYIPCSPLLCTSSTTDCRKTEQSRSALGQVGKGAPSYCHHKWVEFVDLSVAPEYIPKEYVERKRSEMRPA